ncbi:Cof-like hydrolase [gut metagenome]|uniref:Cof-like hydrolase n=1 Tax=gut metagenome TaxID=749906 RepID=J9CGC0_9ZZZZ
MIKAILLDIDGTILSFETHQIPASALTALQQVHEKGIKIIIATGRAAGDLREIESVPYDAVIALNGAECYLRNGPLIKNRPIPRKDFQKAATIARQYDIALGLELNNGVFVDKLKPAVVQVARMVDHPIPEVKDIEALFDAQGCSQFCFYCDLETEKKIMPQLPGLSATRWHPAFTDVNLSGTSKASGLTLFAAYYGIDAANILACGDGGNDIPMLQAAGIGVAMGNASDEVKKHANYVTEPIQNDGLAKVLQHFQLI